MTRPPADGGRVAELVADAVLDLHHMDVAVEPPMMDLNDPRLLDYLDPELRATPCGMQGRPGPSLLR